MQNFPSDLLMQQYQLKGINIKTSIYYSRNIVIRSLISERKRERERDRERQTDRQAETQRDRERQRGRETETAETSLTFDAALLKINQSTNFDNYRPFRN